MYVIPPRRHFHNAPCDNAVPLDALSEVLKVASELTESFDVAALLSERGIACETAANRGFPP